jgi:DNA uptake protein ComE-like DNA-binding protein
MARRRFGIFKRASQEGEESPDQAPEEGTAVHPLTTATAEHDRVEETGDFAPVDETGEVESNDEGTVDFEAFSEPEASAEPESPAEPEAPEEPEATEPRPLPPLEPDGEVARRIRAAAEAAAEEAGRVLTDEVAVLEQRVEEAGETATSGAAEAERRVAAAEQRASEAERIAHQAERRAEAAEARATALEQRLAELEVAAEKEATGRVQGAPGSDDPVAEELAELRTKVEDEARSAASRWLRGQLEAARESADARQAQAVEAARSEAERETLEKIAAADDGGAELASEAHAEEIRKLREELAAAHAELDRASATPRHTNGNGNGNGHDPAVDEARAQAREARERAERAERERVALEQSAGDYVDESAEARLNELRAELEAVRAELAETSPESARRIEEKLAAARRAAEETLGAELRVRTTQLDREREARLLAAEAAEERLRTVEERAIDAAERIAVAERFVETEPQAPAARPGGAAVAVAPTQISLSEATYSELLSSGMSVGQAKRVLRRRAEEGPFTSVEQLDELAEFAPGASEDLRSRLTP